MANRRHDKAASRHGPLPPRRSALNAADKGGRPPADSDGPGTASHFEELADVTLASSVHVATLDRELPAGSHGTVVGVWQGGRAYEVEFVEPFECLVTVPAEGLRS